MTKNTQLSNRTANRQAQSIIDDLDNGYLAIYSGPQPADGDTPITSQVLLATPRLKSPAAPAPVDGVITFTPPDPVNASSGGRAVWYRYLNSDGVTAVMDGNIGVSGSNMNLNSTQFVAGAQVTITGLTHTVDKSFAGQ